MSELVLLAVDAGNTSVALGLFRGKRLVKKARLASDPAIGSAELARRLRAFSGEATAACCASVVPALDGKIDRAVRKALGVEPAWVTPTAPLGIRYRVERPRQVGADRIANAIGAWELHGGPAVVLDFGTATTFDCVSRAGDYLGGAILPGPVLAARALADHTAKLPLVPVRRPRRVIGRETVECIQAGVYFGYLGMIEKVLKLTLAELARSPEGGKARVVLATGGWAGLLADDLPAEIKLAPDLTLHGLRFAYDRLRNKIKERS